MSSKEILVTGGAGYIGAVLVPELVSKGHSVTVLDAFLYGTDPNADPIVHERCRRVQADIRDSGYVDSVLKEGRFDTIIHLAAISNDPSSALDPEVTRSVNLEAVEHLMHSAKRHGVKRFLYASSASVYGIKDTENVTEDLPLEPITIYAEVQSRRERQSSTALVDDEFRGSVCAFRDRVRLLPATASRPDHQPIDGPGPHGRSDPCVRRSPDAAQRTRSRSQLNSTALLITAPA